MLSSVAVCCFASNAKAQQAISVDVGYTLGAHSNMYPVTHPVRVKRCI